jgi:DNA polymerase-3 subunit delta
MSAIQVFQQLHKDLKQGKIASIYLLHGQEEGLVSQSANSIGEFALIEQPEELRSINYLQFEGKGLDMEAFADAVLAAPLFAARKVVRLSNTPLGSGRDEEDKTSNFQERLTNIVAATPESTVLVLESAAVNKSRKLYKLIAGRGIALEFAPLNRQDAQRVIVAEAKRCGVIFETRAIARLCDLVGVDGKTPCLRILKNEVQKLAAYKGFSGSIESEDVSLLVERSAETKMWDFTDAIAARDQRKALGVLQELWQDGNEPLRVLASLSRHFGSVLTAKHALQEGLSPEQIMPLLGLAPFPAQKCIRSAQSMSLEELKHGLSSCVELDFAIKSGRRNPVVGLELLVHSVCERRT